MLTCSTNAFCCFGNGKSVPDSSHDDSRGFQALTELYPLDFNSHSTSRTTCLLAPPPSQADLDVSHPTTLASGVHRHLHVALHALFLIRTLTMMLTLSPHPTR